MSENDSAIPANPAVDDFEDAHSPAERAAAARGFIVDLDGYGGPLDLLLDLARDQKVDLARLSMLQLAEQYLEFVARARHLRLELAADYLVMAAWLAYLKSRLLLPPPIGDDEPTGEQLAARLRFQLQRLEAFRAVAAKLMARRRLGIDVFARGAPQPLVTVREPQPVDTLYDLLSAYAQPIARRNVTSLRLRPLSILSIEEATTRLHRILGEMPDWASLEALLPASLRGLELRSALASTFAASLELTRQGKLELRQGTAFGPMFVKAREEA